MSFSLGTQDKVPCNNLGKTFFSASIIKKKLGDDNSMDMFSSHKNIGTLLEIAGLNAAAVVHYSGRRSYRALARCSISSHAPLLPPSSPATTILPAHCSRAEAAPP
jgi:hypothetical protein